MKTKVTTSIYIDAEPSAVFGYLSDLKYHTLWNPNLRRVSPIVPLEEGTRYRTTSMLFGVKVSGSIQVMKLIPNKLLQLCSVTGMLEYEVTFSLKAKKGGTEVDCRTVASTESKAFAFAKPMMGLLVSRELRSDLESLKKLVEEQGTPSAVNHS